MSLLVGAIALAQVGSGALLGDAQAWEAKPDWVATPAAQCDVTGSVNGILFAVESPGARMKWVRAVRRAWLELAPWLLLRYRAQGLVPDSDDYLVYVHDGVSGGLYAVALADAQADGEWHTLAVRLEDRLAGRQLIQVAVQVAAREGETAWVEFAKLELVPEPPADAHLLSDSGPQRPHAAVPLGGRDDWVEQPAWLDNEGPAGIEGTEQGLRFVSHASGRGMKWSLDLPERLSLVGWRYATLKYRAAGGAHSDYAVCLLGERDDKPDYVPLVHVGELRQDGRLRLVTVPLGDALARVPTVTGLACQVQAAAAGAWFELVSLEFTAVRVAEQINSSTMLSPIAEWPGPDWGNLSAATILDPLVAGPGWTSPGDMVLRAAGLSRSEGWLAPMVEAAGVPFEVAGFEAVEWVAPGAPYDLAVPVGLAGSELYLLVVAGMVGDDDPARGEHPLTHVPGPDGFVVDLEYFDEVTERCIPAILGDSALEQPHWGLEEGLQVLRIGLRDNVQLARAVVRVLTDQVGLGVLASTLRVGPAAHSELDEEFALAPGLSDPAPPPGPCTVALAGADRIHVETPELAADIGEGLRLETLYHRILGVDVLATSTEPLVTFVVDGDEVPADQVVVESVVTSSLPGGGPGAALSGTCRGLRWNAEVGATPEFGMSLMLSITNTGPAPVSLAVRGPRLRAVLPGVGEPVYCYPRLNTLVSDEDTDLTTEYSGWGVTHQFLAAGAADGSGSVALYTADTDGMERSYRLAKQGHEVVLEVLYPARPLGTGEERRFCPAHIGCTAGDWHGPFERYRAWAAEALAPSRQRPRWFREVWNFRQRFLYWLDPLWTDRTGPPDLQAAVDEAVREFGGIEYLHVFDWGTAPDIGRVYARTGDVDPGEHWPGGYPAMRDAMDSIRAQGIRVGLYIEGYLLETKSPLGQRIGQRVAVLGPDGKPSFWPNATEVFACPGVAEWRAIQAETYGRVAELLNSDGMYVDQYGFCSSWRLCYSPEHGHPVPGNPIQSEALMLRQIREALDERQPGAVMYSEESPPDCNARLQDGSFTYSMNRHLASRSRIPLNLRRFAMPDFKTIEILVCDKPTANWGTGVAWVFWNGEAIWLEGPAQEWFSPGTLAMIRKCHGVLSRHSKTFSSDRVTPLVPTLAGGVYANRFEGEDETIYTLYNARHTSYEGPVLAIPDAARRPVADLWNGGNALVTPEGSVAVRLGPMGVGCISVPR